MCGMKKTNTQFPQPLPQNHVVSVTNLQYKSIVESYFTVADLITFVESQLKHGNGKDNEELVKAGLSKLNVAWHVFIDDTYKTPSVVSKTLTQDLSQAIINLINRVQQSNKDNNE